MSKENTQESNNVKIKGIVKFCGKSDGKNVITLKLTSERAEQIITALKLDSDKYEGTPVKENDTGDLLFRASSKFDVSVYETTKGGLKVESDEITVDDIGEDSEVSIFIGIGESTYRKKVFQVAYLKSILLIDHKQSEKFNAFESDEVTEI